MGGKEIILTLKNTKKWLRVYSKTEYSKDLCVSSCYIPGCLQRKIVRFCLYGWDPKTIAYIQILSPFPFQMLVYLKEWVLSEYT